MCVMMFMLIDVSHAQFSPRYKDPVERGLHQAQELYRTGQHRLAKAKMKEVLRLMEQLSKHSGQGILPKRVNEWSGGDLDRDELRGAGFSLTRHYTYERKGIYLKLTKNSAEADKIIRKLSNNAWVWRSGRRSHIINGFRAVMESERKLQMAIGNGILLEVQGDDDTAVRDIIRFTGRLDIARMRWVK